MKKRELKKIQKKYEKAKNLEEKKRMNGMIGLPDTEYKNLDMSKSAFDQAGSFNDKEFSDIRKQFQQKLRNSSILKIRKSIEDNVIAVYKFDLSVIK